MTVNRLIKSKPRLHELMIYGLLQKYYKKQIGISKYESLDNNNNKEVKRSNEGEQELCRENSHDYIRKNERIHYIDDDNY